jgi:tripeptide aminopeptidase
MSSVVERFLRYVQVDTQSAYDAESFPSTAKQLNLAHILADELKDLGLEQVGVDANGYVMGWLPSNLDHPALALGLIAHMDTSPELSGAGVCPKIVERYDGGDILLSAEKHIVLSPRDFPELLEYKGQAIITTDGSTLLGADDKAGVAEIVAALGELAAHPERPHGRVCVCFTPDEEVGSGADRFDIPRFGADLAYTMDGGEIGEFNFENFNAARARIILHGKSVHPGSAKGKLINAAQVATELDHLLPPAERPEYTEGYEGFYHLSSLHGSVETAELVYILRDHDRAKFEARKQVVAGIVAFINQRYGAGTAELAMEDQYYNMREKLAPEMPVVKYALSAMQAAGVTPRVLPIRGGTDGARLTFMGLPTPNLFAGGHNFHGRYEYVPIPSMEKAVEVILKLVELYGQAG